MSEPHDHPAQSSGSGSPGPSVSPKNPQLVFKPMKEGWKGWHIIGDPKTQHIDAGICQGCGQYYKRPDQKRLITHKMKCNPSKASETHGQNDVENQSVSSDCSNENLESVTDISLVRLTKKRPSSEVQVCEKPVRKPKVHISLAEMMLRFNIPFENVPSKHLNSLVKNLDPSYQIPTKEEFQKNVLPRTVGDLIQSNIASGISKIMLAQNILCNGNDSIVSVAITKDYRQILIDVKVLDTLTEEAFYNSCESSARTVYNLYQIHPSYILHNTCYEGDSFNNQVCDGATYYVRCLNQLLDDLELNHDPFPISNANKNIIDKYYDAINNLRHINLETNSIDLATKAVLELADNPDFSMNKSVKTKIEKFLSPIHYAGMFFNPEYHMKYLNPERRLKLVGFVNSVIKKNCQKMSWLGFYTNRSNDFMEIFEHYKDDCEAFWAVAAASYPDLSKFASTLLNLPATPVINHIEKICREFIDSDGQSDELKCLKLSVLLEDCK